MWRIIQDVPEKAASAADPVVRLGGNLTRYHKVVDALLAGAADSDDGRSALANLRSWQKTSEGLPPHIVAGERLATEIQQDVGLVLDCVPDLSSVWTPEFDDLTDRLHGLTDRYRSHQDSYDESLGRAFGVAQQVARLADRLVRAADRSAEPSAPESETPGPEAEPPAGTRRRIEHSDDFGWISLDEREFTFTGQARAIVQLLFEVARESDYGMEIAKIGTKIGSQSNRFRLEEAFRGKGGRGYRPGYAELVEKIDGKRARIKPELVSIWRGESPNYHQ